MRTPGNYQAPALSYLVMDGVFAFLHESGDDGEANQVHRGVLYIIHYYRESIPATQPAN